MAWTSKPSMNRQIPHRMHRPSWKPPKRLLLMTSETLTFALVWGSIARSSISVWPGPTSPSRRKRHSTLRAAERSGTRGSVPEGWPMAGRRASRAKRLGTVRRPRENPVPGTPQDPRPNSRANSRATASSSHARHNGSHTSTHWRLPLTCTTPTGRATMCSRAA